MDLVRVYGTQAALKKVGRFYINLYEDPFNRDLYFETSVLRQLLDSEIQTIAASLFPRALPT